MFSVMPCYGLSACWSKEGDHSPRSQEALAIDTDDMACYHPISNLIVSLLRLLERAAPALILTSSSQALLISTFFQVSVYTVFQNSNSVVLEVVIERYWQQSWTDGRLHWWASSLPVLHSGVLIMIFHLSCWMLVSVSHIPHWTGLHLNICLVRMSLLKSMFMADWLWSNISRICSFTSGICTRTVFPRLYPAWHG